MLLEHHLLTAGDGREAAARVWRHRETVELEAADQFDRLALALAEVGAPAVVVDLARGAADDEREHARLCRRLVDRLAAARLPPVAPRLGIELGPRELSPRRRALYASVAISCITETLSAALLIEMRSRADDEVVADTVQHILRDEVRHSRLGWAHLAAEAERGDVSWLGRHIDAMLGDAVRSDLAPMTATKGAPGLGVLGSDHIRRIVDAAVADVITPGLRRFGIDFQACPAPSSPLIEGPARGGPRLTAIHDQRN